MCAKLHFKFNLYKQSGKYSAKKTENDKIGFNIYLPARTALVMKVEK